HSELFSSSHSRMGTFAVIDDQFVRNALSFVDLRHVRQCQDGDVSIGKPSPNNLQRRKRDNGVAHPIGRTDEELHGSASGMAETKALTFPQNSSSSGISMATSQQYSGSSGRNSPRFCRSFSVVINAAAPVRFARSFSFRISLSE